MLPMVAFALLINPIINAMITKIMKITRTVAMILPNPTLEISPIASPIANASPKSSVFANLHFAIKLAKANMMIKIILIMVSIQSLRKIPKTKIIIAGIM